MKQLRFPLSAALASMAWAALTVAQNAPQRPPTQPPTSSSQNTWAPDGTDEVIVGFSNAPARAPVVTGPLWNGNQPPPTQQGSGSRSPPMKVQKRGIAQAQSQVGTQTRPHRKHVKKSTAPPEAAAAPAPAAAPVKN